MNVLVVNAGSSSLKYQLFDTTTDKVLAKGICERIGIEGGKIEHKRSREYASHIMEAIYTNTPYRIGGNVLNRGVITNLPYDACVEVTFLVDGKGIHPTFVGELPLQLAAMNSSNIYPQMLTIEAAHTMKKETIYQAAMMDPHTGAQLSTDEIVALCDELFEAHEKAGYPIF